MSKIIAIPSTNPGGLKVNMNPRFGRCEKFTIVTLDPEITEVKIIDNPGISAMGGAGSLAVQTVAQEHAQVVLGGTYGPNASMALNRAGIEVYTYTAGAPILVERIIELYQQGDLGRITEANVPSHFGMK